MSDSWAREVERFFHSRRERRKKPDTPKQARLNSIVRDRHAAELVDRAEAPRLDELAERDEFLRAIDG